MYSVKQMRAINDALVEEFRANDGQVKGPTGNSRIVVLTTTGSRTGQAHVTPLAYTRDGDRVVLIASKGGGPTNPSWYYNLIKQPVVTVELPGETFQARASVVTGEERDRLYEAMAAQIPTFAEYERVSPRRIPVVVLERLPEGG
jgi:deazaflavin-dependent oxidoreductase (nitroreductase family)